MKSPDIDIFEEQYCQLRANGGMTQRECYEQALAHSGRPATENEETIKTRIKRLEKEPKIISRISEIKAEACAKNAELWANRKEEVCECMYRGIIAAAHDPDIRIHGAVKTIGVLADLKGWKTPEKIDLSTSGTIGTDEVNRKLDALLMKGVKDGEGQQS